MTRDKVLRAERGGGGGLEEGVLVDVSTGCEGSCCKGSDG